MTEENSCLSPLTNDGARLKIGDVFFYRGAGSPSAAVNKVIVRSLEGNIAGLSLVDIFESGYEDSRPQPNLYVEIGRIEVVMRCGPLKIEPAPLGRPPLPKHLIKPKKNGI